MRITVEIPDDLRSRLVALAARRGIPGFSPIVTEALERYLREEADVEKAKRVNDALAALGSLPAGATGLLRRRVRQARRRGRT
jgi:metal-responsive CopG/Arc/MetJ family transcriptional regulator